MLHKALSPSQRHSLTLLRPEPPAPPRFVPIDCRRLCLSGAALLLVPAHSHRQAEVARFY